MNLNLTKGKITKLFKKTSQTSKRFKTIIAKNKNHTFRNKPICKFFNSTIKKITY